MAEVMSFDEVKKTQERVDIYRDTPIRYLGYSNEVGEAFRSLVHVNVVRASYVAASAYVLADTLDKAKLVNKKFAHLAGEERRKRVAQAAADTLLWQAAASVVIPGITINRLCAASTWLFNRTHTFPPTVRKWVVTAIGLGAIPFIVKPIDAAVELGMDRAIRPLYPFQTSHESHKD